MSAEIRFFIEKLRKFANDIYINDNLEQLNQELAKINEMYDTLLNSNNINNFAKEFILCNFIKYQEVNKFIVPVIKKMSIDIDEKYRRFYFVNTNTLGPI